MAKNIEEIAFGKQRYALADLIVELVEAGRNDWFPLMTTWEFFQHLTIVRLLYAMEERGQPASVSVLSRETKIPPTTVQQRLHQLLELGAVEQRGDRYVLSPPFFNSKFMLNGFKRRRVIVTIASEDMSDLSDQ